MKDVEMVEPTVLSAVAEPEFQYGAEVLEAFQQIAKVEIVVVPEVKMQKVEGKSR